MTVPVVTTVEVRPPSVKAETLGVARAVLVILLASSFVIFSSSAASKAQLGITPQLLPYQRLFATLDAADQRMIRSLQEAMLEAENVRLKTKRWPDASMLAGDGVAPFAPNPMDRDRFEWQLVQGGVFVNYLGLPQGGAMRPEFLMLFVEPDPNALRLPGEKPPPSDEQHHTLTDGTALHVSLWMRPARGALVDKIVPFPASEGWTQILSKPMDPTL